MCFVLSKYQSFLIDQCDKAWIVTSRGVRHDVTAKILTDVLAHVFITREECRDTSHVTIHTRVPLCVGTPV